MVRVSARLGPARAISFRFGALSMATLALALLAALGGPLSAQNAGCSRCSPSSVPDSVAVAPAEPDRHWERRWYDETPSRRRRASSSEGGGGATGGSEYVCVKPCDGSFFPLPYSGASGLTLEDICQALCPNAKVALYTMPFGGTIDQGVSSTGSPYMELPNALKFQQSYETSCSCRRPGQSWAQALAAAEARLGHRAHEVVVTEEASLMMSRPKPDPNPKSQPSNAAAAKDNKGLPIDPVDPGLDINGVDTKLKAATAAVSRETSGIKDQAAASGSYFGLKDGHVVDESGPDGGERRVRIVAPMF